MRVVHFTCGAMDSLWNSTSYARDVPLADGFGTTRLSYPHSEPGAKVTEAASRHIGVARNPEYRCGSRVGELRNSRPEAPPPRVGP